MIKIEVPNLNDSTSRITLEGREFLLRFTYNPTYDYWTLGLYTVNYVPLIPMTKIVPNVSLLHYYTYTELPEGVFMCVSEKDRIGKEDFINDRAKLVYMTSAELDFVWGDKWRTG